MDNVNRWKSVVEVSIQKNASDFEMQHELKESLSQIEKKWSTLHVFVKDYRDMLNKKSAFCKLYDEVDCWLQKRTQVINKFSICKTECRDLKEVERILVQIDQNIDDMNYFSDTKIKHLTQVALEINGILKFYSKLDRVFCR